MLASTLSGVLYAWLAVVCFLSSSMLREMVLMMHWLFHCFPTCFFQKPLFNIVLL